MNFDNISGCVLRGWHYGMVYSDGIAYELYKTFEYVVEAKNFEAYQRIYRALKALGFDFDDWSCYSANNDDPDFIIRPNDWTNIKKMFKAENVKCCVDCEHG